MNKRATSVARSSSTETYRQRLIEKRDQVVSGLGVKFDTIAKMGRIAEEDQAQLSHDEFVSLRLNSLDYGQLRLVEEAQMCIRDRICSGYAPPVRLRPAPRYS